MAELREPLTKRRSTYRHGSHKNPLYRAWRNMILRCTDRKNKDYHSYGGRGISVCEQWLVSFKTFAEDMGAKPSPAHTLERSKTNGNYCPENCRWATLVEQANNKRTNRLLTFDDRTMTIAAWATERGMQDTTLWARIVTLKWPVEKALFTQVRGK